MLFSMSLVAVGPVAGLGEIRKILGEIVSAQLDDSYDVILTGGHEAVDLVAGIGEDITFVKGVGAVAVLKQYLAFKYQHEFSILMIVDGILLDVCDGNIYREIILISDLFKKHLFGPFS